MAAISSAASGNYSVGATWVGGVAPLKPDDATILSAHTVTLDATGQLCKSLTINVGGTLAASTTANSALQVGDVVGDTINVALAGTINIDLSSVPAITCTISLNAGGNTSGRGIAGTGTSVFTFKGAPKKRHTRLSGAIVATAITATVADATGWRVGDRIIFGTTQAYNATPRIDEVTLTAVNTATGVIDWVGGITYDHASLGYVGNFTSNAKITNAGGFRAFVAANGTGGVTIQDALFENLAEGPFAQQGLSLNAGPTTGSILNNNAIYSTHANNSPAVFMRLLNGPVTRQDNIIYCTFGSAIGGGGSVVDAGSWERLIIFRAGNSGFVPLHPAEKFVDCVAMACMGSSGGGFQNGSFGQAVEGGAILACLNGIYLVALTIPYCELIRTSIGEEFGASNSNMFNFIGTGRYITKNCLFQSAATQYANMVAANKPIYIGVDLINKDNSAISQEKQYPHCEIKRNNTEVKRSTSSVSIKPVRLITNSQYTLEIACSNTKSIRLVGYVKFDTSFNNAGDYTAPTVTISGLSITPVVFTATAAANNAFELFDILATNNVVGYDGNFTVTFNANAKTVTTGTVYFDGVTTSPFVTLARHYGFLFDESNPVRVVNPDTVVVEATAAAYTGTTITIGTKRVTFGAGTIDTLAKLYDYSQAWGCLNLTSEMPWTKAGSALSLVSGWRVLDPVISGITWSGGTVYFSTAGTKTANISSAIVEFLLVGTYSLTGTMSGTLDLRNLQASAITVEVPSGTTTTTANNTGGAITVSAPALYQSVTISGAAASSRVQIYDISYIFTVSGVTVTPTAGATYTNNGVTFTVISASITAGAGTVTARGLGVPGTSGTLIKTAGTGDATIAFSAYSVTGTELFNGTPTFPYAWTDSVAAIANRVIRVRVARQTTVTAKNFIDALVGTCGITSATAAVSYLVTQTEDTTYNSNAIDGSTVTGITIGIGPKRVSISLAGGATTWPRIYAYQVFWQFGATGIADNTAFIAAPDTANYLVTDFDVRNTSAVPLTITGGWGRDAVTLTVAGCIDHTGSTGNIYPEPDHVTAFATGSALTAGQDAQLMGLPSASTTGAAVLATVADGTMTLAESIRIHNAMLSGKVSGAGSGTETFRNPADTKNRVVVTTDTVGNRTAVVRDVT